MIDYLSIIVITFARSWLTSLSVDEILLSRLVNLSTNSRGQPLRLQMAPCFKRMYSVLFVLMRRPTLPSVCLGKIAGGIGVQLI